MLVVVDTNIIVNALKSSSPNSKAMRLLDDIYLGKHIMCISSPIMAEYKDVLFRKELRISQETVSGLLKWIEQNAIHAEPLPTTEKDVSMKDEDDRAFFDLAKCLNARLVTRNYRHYPVHELITLIDELY